MTENKVEYESRNHHEELLAVNVNEHTEQKSGLTYLSWAWAWAEVIKRDSTANYQFISPHYFGETMMVFCEVTIYGKTITAYLPVMDHRNKAIPNPDAFAVNKAMMRCLTKGIAMHGLGLYIYAGEDLPEGDDDKRTSTKKAGKKEAEPAQLDKTQLANVKGWIAAMEAEVKHGRVKAEWWAEHKADVLKDCSEAGAKQVHAAMTAYSPEG